jgi:hypothetical protein
MCSGIHVYQPFGGTYFLRFNLKIEEVCEYEMLIPNYTDATQQHIHNSVAYIPVAKQ